MDENKEILMDDLQEEQPEEESPEIFAAEVPDNEAEIAGKINEFVSYMMGNHLKDAGADEFVKRVVFLIACYEKGYRHSYYNISSAIYSGWDGSQTQFNNLVSWMDTLKEFFNDDRIELSENVRKSINKFYDHIMLEIVRMTDHQKKVDNINKIIEGFQDNSDDEFVKHELTLQQIVAEFENRFVEADDKFSEINKKANKTQKKVKNMYSQFVSILGIFSAIVIVFFGGAAVFSSVLTNIHQAKWYQIGMGVSCVGLVLFDIIFMFLFILSKFLDVTISTKEYSTKRFTILKWIDKYPYVFWFNFFCMLIMIVCA